MFNCVCVCASFRYPLILSIENHCNLVQQRNMATSFREVFGDALLTDVLDANAKTLPSPNQLKYKILLKVREWVMFLANGIISYPVMRNFQSSGGVVWKVIFKRVIVEVWLDL